MNDGETLGGLVMVCFAVVSVESSMNLIMGWVLEAGLASRGDEYKRAVFLDRTEYQAQ